MKLLFSGEFAINFSRGIMTLAVGKLLYDETASLLAFALVFLLEFVFAVLLQGFAGSSVDKYGCRKVLLIANFTAVLTLIGAIVYLFDGVVPSVLIALSVILNLTRPFIRNAIFSLIPEITSVDRMAKANGLVSIAMQLGQAAGIMAAGILLELTSHLIILLVVLFGFIFSLACYNAMSTATTTSSVRGLEERSTKPVHDWSAVIEAIRRQPAILTIYLFTAIDFAAIAIFNILLAPVVTHYFDNNNLWLTGLDLCFTAGAVIAGVALAKLNTLSQHAKLTSLSTTIAACLLFGCYSIDSPLALAIPLIVYLGISSTLSSVSWSTLLQKISDPRIKGKLASLRFIINSFYVTIATLSVSFAEGYSLQMAGAFSALLMIAFLGIAGIHHFFEQRMSNQPNPNSVIQ